MQDSFKIFDKKGWSCSFFEKDAYGALMHEMDLQKKK